MPTYFIDTNIFMYAAGGAHPLQKPCQEIIHSIAEGKIEAAINSEVLQEILHRYLALRRREEAFECIENALSLVDTCWPLTGEEVRQTKDLITRYTTLTARDAIHISSMLAHEVREMISTDRDFDAVKEIRRVDPSKLTS